MPNPSRIRRQESPKPREGCIGHFATCLIACVLLVVNGTVALSLYEYLRPQGLSFLAQPKVAQAAMFVAPILMMLIEWWIFDFFFGRRQFKPSK